MKESVYKSYDELPLFLNAETVAKLVRHFPIQRIRTDARKGLSGFENRKPHGRAERKIPRMGGAEHGRKRMRSFYHYSKRDAIKNYFPLPNEIFMLDLSAGEIAVYAYLLYREDRKTFRCYSSYKTIGNAVGMSRNTVKKYVDGLIEKRLIEAEPTQVTKKHGRHNGNLCYTVRPIEEAVLANYDRQMARLKEESRRQTALENWPNMTNRKRNERYERGALTAVCRRAAPCDDFEGLVGKGYLRN